MPKLTKSINEHREDDLKLIRQVCLDILNSKEQKNEKAKVEAGKLLGRLHQALQPDKTYVKSSPKPTKPKLKPEHAKSLQEILNKHE